MHVLKGTNRLKQSMLGQCCICLTSATVHDVEQQRVLFTQLATPDRVDGGQYG